MSLQNSSKSSPQGVGASLRRNEDARFLDGKGEYLADLQVPGMAEVFFLRSPVSHGKIRSITVPEAARDQVFFASDIAFTKPILAVSAAKGFKPSNYPALTSDKARFVGDLLAICIAPTRAEAEDIAQACVIDFEELPAVWDIDVALKPDAPRVHDSWSDNVYIETRIAGGDLDAVRARADVTVRKSLRMGRHAGVSMEGRGVLAHYDRRLDELVVYSSTQFPHVIRTILADSLGISESRLRVIAPDVGGGFGPKNNFNPEELAIAALSMKLNRPLRWIEDRREHLTASPHAREHRYELTAYADRYARAVSVATNKSPLGPYRGVGRSGACFAIETLVDAVARAVGREPAEVRILNMVPPEAMPYKSVTHKLYDSGNYPECARRACDAVGLPAVRARQSRPEPDRRLIGFGMASYTEQSAHGTAEWVARGLPVVFGYEPALARFTPDGKLILFVGIQNHGQGLETTLAQVANQELGIPVRDVIVRHGDSSVSPYGMGTFASRSMTMSGGAVSAACVILAEKIARIGAHLLQAPKESVRLADGRVYFGEQSVSFADIGQAAYLHPERLPVGEEPACDAYLRARRRPRHRSCRSARLRRLP